MIDMHAPVDAQRTPRPGDGRTVLLVEDEPTLLDMLSTVLRRAGYTVLACPSPAAAIREADAHDGTIDLLLTDVVMPDMNGRDLANRVLAGRPRAGCLFMSGYTADVVIDAGELDAEAHFIQKPFAMSKLLAAVNAIAAGSSPAR